MFLTVYCLNFYHLGHIQFLFIVLIKLLCFAHNISFSLFIVCYISSWYAQLITSAFNLLFCLSYNCQYFTCNAYLVLYFRCMLHACYLLFILCLCMSVKSSTELMLYVVLTMPTLNKAYLFIYLFIYLPEGSNLKWKTNLK